MTISSLVDRLCRPQRIGLFGHRGVGKTTLLTMLYREAVGGRLPEVRLAAGNAATATYLADKILHLENGEPLPATLAETELRMQLYQRGSRLELLVKDYQGEHVRVGSTESIRDFLRDCDAVLLCLDPAILDNPRARLEAQQEVEQVVEDYLALEKGSAIPRPMTLVLTKSDRLPVAPENQNQAEQLRQLVESQLGMTLHALKQHAPQHTLLAVSALGGLPGKTLQPHNLGQPLQWLADVLQMQDEQRLAQLWEVNSSVAVLQRATDCVAQRYPEAAFVQTARQRLQERLRQRRRRRTLAGVVAAAACALGLYSYDAVGSYNMQRRDQNESDPAVLVQEWQHYQNWHPARHLLGFGSAHTEQQRIHDLEYQCLRQQAAARLAALKVRAANPDSDFEEVWEQYVACQREFTALAFDDEMAQLRTLLKERRDLRFEQRAELAMIDLRQAQELVTSERDLQARRLRLVQLVTQTDQFVKTFAGAPQEREAKERRAATSQRIDDLDFELARRYSSENPLNFQTRREHYLAYLDQHPQGRHAATAQNALEVVDRDWERHDWRPVVEQWKQQFTNLKEVTARCQHYIRLHPQGRQRDKAEELVRWCAQVGSEREYRVVLKSGSFDKNIARTLRSAPDLSVELEVGGVKYGPSPVVKDSLTPEWNYEFARPVRWKLGDEVRILIANHDYYKKTMMEINSFDDPLAIKFLSQAVLSGNNSLTFESDFWLPVAPELD